MARLRYDLTERAGLLVLELIDPDSTGARETGQSRGEEANALRPESGSAGDEPEAGSPDS